MDADVDRSYINMKKKQEKLKTILQENQYMIPSYELYGGLSGYQDYGILGCIIKNKLVNTLRKFFITNDEIFEVESPIVVPYDVLKASGHVDRFTDFIVYDNNGICYRADHLLKDWFKNNDMKYLVDTVDSWDQETLEFNINKYKIIKGIYNEKTNTYFPVKVEKKNLMFEITSLNKNKMDFLRPEIAQCIFVNFKQYQQFLQKEPPFGIAQIGNSFRKEISPKQFLRLRSFSQFELEYFVDPLNKIHSDYDKLKNLIIPLLTSKMQIDNMTLINIPLKDAVDNKLIDHELMAFFLGKIYQFALYIGLKPNYIRFRQHMDNEKAHYALLCWDLETFVNGDWLECVGCADRGSYDIEAHEKYLNTSIKAKRYLEEPILSKKLIAILDMKLLGQKYKAYSTIISKYFNELSQEQLIEIKEKEIININIENKIYIFTKDEIKIEEEIKNIYLEEYYPKDCVFSLRSIWMANIQIYLFMILFAFFLLSVNDKG